MRFRTWPVAALGLAGLLLLIVYSLRESAERTEAIYQQLDQVNSYHHSVDRRLRLLRSDIYNSGIFVRDYLLDVQPQQAAESRARLEGYRKSSQATVEELRQLAGPDGDRIQRLEGELSQYWAAFDPLFTWTPSDKAAKSAAFIRSEVIPRRAAATAIANEIEALNEANRETERTEVARRHVSSTGDLNALLWQTLALGIVVALAATFRLRLLERRSEDQRAAAEQAEHEMRELSQRLVAAQEEERKHLSRELHDHVAQVLTALRMELGRIDRNRQTDDTRLGDSVAECRRLIDALFSTVRDLSLGLRPSMLDDFGLQAALEWHIRDFNRRYGVKADLYVAGSLQDIPDRQRLCAYRAVQEALTNCARHAGATAAMVSVVGDADRLRVSVTDDGVGMDVKTRPIGLGLRGIEERVHELNGTFTIDSQPSEGTTVTLALPLPEAQHDDVKEVPGASIAG